MQSEMFAANNFAAQSEGREGLHVAIIMDGNGRWAAQRGWPRVAGHREGVATVRRVVERAPELGIARLTLYAFSSDNWRRPAFEVRSIFSLIAAYLRIERERLKEVGARLEAIGRRDRLPRLLLREIEGCEAATAGGQRLHLRVAVDYSSRETIARTAAGLVGEGGTPSHDALEQGLAVALQASGGDVDLLIRTGGEKRLSDFLLWESAYAELVFTDRMWPDFDGTDLDAAVEEFRRRERRFGGVPAANMQAGAVAAGCASKAGELPARIQRTP
ncbi:MAG: di-trans,poly-cis-decaprenylcistransferase [Acidobacteriaceae bacterium]